MTTTTTSDATKPMRGESLGRIVCNNSLPLPERKTTYRVEKEFIGGILDGLVYVERWGTKPKVGTIVLKPIGGSPYRIKSVEEIREG